MMFDLYFNYQIIMSETGFIKMSQWKTVVQHGTFFFSFFFYPPLTISKGLEQLGIQVTVTCITYKEGRQGSLLSTGLFPGINLSMIQ